MGVLNWGLPLATLNGVGERQHIVCVVTAGFAAGAGQLSTCCAPSRHDVHLCVLLVCPICVVGHRIGG
jgi:hypothetical protein